MVGAVGYALNQWSALTAFLDDPEVPIDNSASERAMKHHALNRKNSLYVGSLQGGETAAILSSLGSTCRRHGVDPQAHLTQLIMNLPGTPAAELGHSLSDAWHRRQNGAGCRALASHDRLSYSPQPSICGHGCG